MCGVLVVKINEAELNEPNAAADPRQEKLMQQDKKYWMFLLVDQDRWPEPLLSGESWSLRCALLSCDTFLSYTANTHESKILLQLKSQDFMMKFAILEKGRAKWLM